MLNHVEESVKIFGVSWEVLGSFLGRLRGFFKNMPCLFHCGGVYSSYLSCLD